MALTTRVLEATLEVLPKAVLTQIILMDNGMAMTAEEGPTQHDNSVKITTSCCKRHALEKMKKWMIKLKI